MRKRDLLFTVIGVLLAVVAVRLITTVRTSRRRYSDDYVLLLNEEISTQRANAIVLAANEVSPAVVSITVTQTKVVSTSPFFSPYADEFFRDFFDGFFPERFHRQQIKSLGTGVIISSDGHILTNEHVIADATDINITLPDGRRFKGDIITSDRSIDLALIEVEADDLPYAELGNSDELLIGEWVIALGNPFGFLLEDTRPTVTVGVVSALNRSIKSTHDERVYKNMIQTDAAINPGNSGGPLVNVLGQVVGINNFIFTSGGGSEGIGFARPIDVAKKFIEEAKKFGRVRTPWIGLWMQDISPEHAEALGIERSGVLVSGVDTGSPAENADIKEADRVIHVNGQRIKRVADWNRCTASVFVDDTLHAVLMRGKDTLEVRFVVAELEESAVVKARFGMYIEDIDERLAKRYRITHREGIIVTRVEKNSVGERAGVVPGDVILKVGNERIRNKSHFQEVLNQTRNITVIIDRRGMLMQVYLGL
jgi:serine protease Do